MKQIWLDSRLHYKVWSLNVDFIFLYRSYHLDILASLLLFPISRYLQSPIVMVWILTDPQNSCVEDLVLSTVVFRVPVLGKWLDHEGSSLMNGSINLWVLRFMGLVRTVLL
jgi:hypothetical protein